MHIFTKMNYLPLLNEFDVAVRSWEINPTLPMTKEDVKETYQKYKSVKRNQKVPIEVQIQENNLVKRCGGLLK